MAGASESGGRELKVGMMVVALHACIERGTHQGHITFIHNYWVRHTKRSQGHTKMLIGAPAKKKKCTYHKGKVLKSINC